MKLQSEIIQSDKLICSEKILFNKSELNTKINITDQSKLDLSGNVVKKNPLAITPKKVTTPKKATTSKKVKNKNNLKSYHLNQLEQLQHIAF